MYYRYYHHDATTTCCAHYGVRTDDAQADLLLRRRPGLPGTSTRRNEPEWELFDLRADPYEIRNVYDDPAYARIRAALVEELARVQRECGDLPWQPPAPVSG